MLGWKSLNDAAQMDCSSSLLLRLARHTVLVVARVSIVDSRQ